MNFLSLFATRTNTCALSAAPFTSTLFLCFLLVSLLRTDPREFADETADAGTIRESEEVACDAQVRQKSMSCCPILGLVTAIELEHFQEFDHFATFESVRYSEQF